MDAAKMGRKNRAEKMQVNERQDGIKLYASDSNKKVIVLSRAHYLSHTLII